MCGRYRCNSECLSAARSFVDYANASSGDKPPSNKNMSSKLHVEHPHGLQQPCENFGPARHGVFIALSNQPERMCKLELRCGIWGLIGQWNLNQAYADKRAKGLDHLKLNHFAMFNARSESAFEKTSFKNLITKQNKRCVIPVNGYYEWHTHKVGNSKKEIKTPYYIYNPQSPHIQYFAGLYDECLVEEQGTTLVSYTILTMSAHDRFKDIHPRQPLLLDEKDCLAYLYGDMVRVSNPNANPPESRTDMNAKKGVLDHNSHHLKDPNMYSLLKDLVHRSATTMSDATAMTWHPVKSEIGNTQYQKEDCSIPYRSDTQGGDSMDIMHFFKKSPSPSTHTVTVDVDPTIEKKDRGSSPALTSGNTGGTEGTQLKSVKPGIERFFTTDARKDVNKAKSIASKRKRNEKGDEAAAGGRSAKVTVIDLT